MSPDETLVPAISFRKAPLWLPKRDRRDTPGDDDGDEWGKDPARVNHLERIKRYRLENPAKRDQ
jgi:hypothetical protein